MILKNVHGYEYAVSLIYILYDLQILSVTVDGFGVKLQDL